MTARGGTEELGRMVGEMARCDAVASYMRGAAWSRLEKELAGRPAGLPVAITFSRAGMWMKTIVGLDGPVHFQAAMAATRALLEMAVDLALINGNPATYPLAKLDAWEKSSLLKYAKSVEARNLAKVPPAPLEKHFADFIAKHETQIKQNRATFWNSKHPGNRWTGTTLSEDAQAAATFLPADEDVHSFYLRMHSLLCWATHGSGAVGFGSLPEHAFAAPFRVALGYSANLAMLVAKLALQHFGAFDAAAEGEYKAAEAGHQQRYEASEKAWLRDHP